MRKVPGTMASSSLPPAASPPGQRFRAEATLGCQPKRRLDRVCRASSLRRSPRGSTPKPWPPPHYCTGRSAAERRRGCVLGADAADMLMAAADHSSVGSAAVVAALAPPEPARQPEYMPGPQPQPPRRRARTGQLPEVTVTATTASTHSVTSTTVSKSLSVVVLLASPHWAVGDLNDTRDKRKMGSCPPPVERLAQVVERGLAEGCGAGRRVSKIGVLRTSDLGSHRDRRPGHSSDRTVCGTDRPDHPRAGLARSVPHQRPVVTDAELVPGGGTGDVAI